MFIEFKKTNIYVEQIWLENILQQIKKWILEKEKNNEFLFASARQSV